MEHGGKREGAGRPKGTTRKKAWRALEELKVKYQCSPLDYMLAVLNNPASSPEKKMYAAERAAPYIHGKAPTTNRIETDPIKVKIKWEE
jgi:hypothetical protein|tara:strand:- start:2160 stop:2426 length:267 start_codon:yes stop_codon:yes gene_type:complete